MIKENSSYFNIYLPHSGKCLLPGVVPLQTESQTQNKHAASKKHLFQRVPSSEQYKTLHSWSSLENSLK